MIDKFSPSFKMATQQKSRIGLLHKNQFTEDIQLTLNNNITDISQKKDLPTSANDTKSIAYLCDTTTTM